MKLFTGPGTHLVIPIEWIDYPEDDCPVCKDNIKRGVNRYTGSNNPDVIAFPHGTFKTLEVPFGWWYDLGNWDDYGNKNSPKLIRPASSEELKEYYDNRKLR